MTRSVKYLAVAAAVAGILSFSQMAQAVALFFGTKSIDLTNNPNDCLTMGIGTLNRLAFAELNRGETAVSGSRQGVFVVITCIPSPAAPQFVMVVMAAGDDGATTKSVTDLVLSNI
jgi:hypothetical protein